MFISRSHITCLIVGAAVGIGGFSLFSPASATPLKAQSTDRTSKFAVASVPADVIGESHAVFVLDFFNGTLVGGVINNQTGKYTHQYFRKLSLDFALDPNTPEPEYAIVGTRGNLQGNNMSKGIIHVAEKSSGKIVAYAFEFANRAPGRVQALQPIDFMQFREATN